VLIYSLSIKLAIIMF